MRVAINTYEQAFAYMNQKLSLGIQPGLERIKYELEILGNPQNHYQVIHIAGTNGKGTVAATVADALTKSGYKVGLFTSPWVTDYREQIQINGEPISEESFTNCVRMLEAMQTDCTEFECLTIAAYTYFSIEKVDYAVIECGLGGKGDATNVEKKNLSVITSLSLDHTDFLGNTLEEIAEEKAGILRKNSDCILYDSRFKNIFEPKCKRLIVSSDADNLSLVNTVLHYLHVAPVENVKPLPARQERIRGVLLDGGHNVSAALALAPLLENETAVIGMMKDKDVEGYLSIVAPKCKKIIAVTPSHFRAMKAEELASRAKRYCGDVTVLDSPTEAVTENEITLICGSFYLAREVRKILL